MMNNKILFWLDGTFIHFGIAKFLQNKFSSHMYAIIDINPRPKKFFENQNLVKFEKTWYYRDSIKRPTEKPDISFLEKFENKYGINLWSIIHTDRNFSSFNEYYKFEANEILSILDQECKFFEMVLDEIQPDFFITRLHDSHHIYLLYEICKARNIKILMLQPSRIPHRSLISGKRFKLDSTIDNSSSENKSFEELRNFLKLGDSFKRSKKLGKITSTSKTKQLEAISQFFLFDSSEQYQNIYSNYGRTKSKVLSTEFKRYLKTKYRKSYIDRNLSRIIPSKRPFVFFPLHVEPEMSLNIAAPFYSNQLEVIKNIARSLPAGYELVVKEHPVQSRPGWHKISFYKEIINLPNVKLLHYSVNPYEILRKCSLAITIAGTIAFEAALNNKPSIIFTDIDFTVLSSIIKIENMKDLPNAIKKALNTPVDLVSLNSYVDYLYRNSFNFDFIDLYFKFGHRFYFGNNLSNTILPISEVSSFLEENKSSFELLTDEHLKKINQIKALKPKSKLKQ